MRLRFLTKKNQKGQASIFMAIFIATMILLFAFTTNVGMMVHAKIALQNAADAAAFAGASVQARQLTAVGYLNYEMRRSTKQFLFNYMVRGNRSQACFPSDGTGAVHPACRIAFDPKTEDRYEFSFRDPRENDNFNEPLRQYLPTVCIIYDGGNNYCQKFRVAGIPEFSGVGGVLVFVNPIINAVQSATKIIIDKKVKDCVGRGKSNLLFLVSWLFNLDPRPTAVNPDGSTDSLDPFPVTNSIDGLGYLPRMALLRARINNYEEALNMHLISEGFGSSEINESLVQQLMNSNISEYYERSIQAYLSAYNNLPQDGGAAGGNGIFSEIELSELIPVQPGNIEGNINLENPPILAKFQDINSNVRVSASTFKSVATVNQGECEQERFVLGIPKFPFGVRKDPEVLTYYAVRLKARVRLLFSPFGDEGSITMSAYSAAKPFGSRIGKAVDLDPNRFIRATGVSNTTDNPFGGFADNFKFPNILVADNDLNADQHGISSYGVLGYLNKATKTPGVGLPGAYQLSGAYSPWDVGFYLAPANFRTLSKFKGNPSFPADRDYNFLLPAPILPYKNPNADLSVIRKYIFDYFVSGAIVQGETIIAPLRAGQLSNDAFGNLFNFLETRNLTRFHPISDPLLVSNPAHAPIVDYARAEGQLFTVTEHPDPGSAVRRQLTSWNTTKSIVDEPNSELSGPGMGRAGYSVRFVAFKNLLEGKIGTNDGNFDYQSPFDRVTGGTDSANLLQELEAIAH